MSKLGDEPAYPGVPDYKMDRLLLDGGQPDPMYRILAEDAEPGLTKRERACIDLRIPESGWGWLDELIVKAQRRDLAADAMQGMEAGLGIDTRRFELMVVVADSEGITMAQVQARESVLAADALSAELAKENE